MKHVNRSRAILFVCRSTEGAWSGASELHFSRDGHNHAVQPFYDQMMNKTWSRTKQCGFARPLHLHCSFFLFGQANLLPHFVLSFSSFQDRSFKVLWKQHDIAHNDSDQREMKLTSIWPSWPVHSIHMHVCEVAQPRMLHLYTNIYQIFELTIINMLWPKPLPDITTLHSTSQLLQAKIAIRMHL